MFFSWVHRRKKHLLIVYKPRIKIILFCYTFPRLTDKLHVLKELPTNLNYIKVPQDGSDTPEPGGVP